MQSTAIVFYKLMMALPKSAQARFKRLNALKAL